MIKVGIVGGTGYTGVELLRLLAQHPQVNVAMITSRSETGVKASGIRLCQPLINTFSKDSSLVVIF